MGANPGSVDSTPSGYAPSAAAVPMEGRERDGNREKPTNRGHRTEVSEVWGTPAFDVELGLTPAVRTSQIRDEAAVARRQSFLNRLQSRGVSADSNRDIEYCAEMLSVDCEIVGTASDGKAAIRAVATSAPDVIVLDVSMPGLNGLEVASRLGGSECRAAIVFCSGTNERRLRSRPSGPHMFRRPSSRPSREERSQKRWSALSLVHVAEGAGAGAAGITAGPAGAG